MKTFSRSISLFLFVCLLAVNAFAQYHGGFQGVVTDPTGARVPGATITATNTATGLHAEATSSDSGSYSINALAGGTYSVTAQKAGFSKQVLESVVLQSETVQALNINLVVASTANQVVTVSAEVLPVLNTESAEIGGTITSKDVQNLPSFGRDPYTLVRLAPGVFGDGALGNDGSANNLPGTNIGAGNGIFAVENGVQITANGERQNANSFQIDGVPVNSAVWGGAPVVTPNEESVKEVKIIANNYSAENGRGAGAQVQVVSQYGTNDLHGSAFFKWHRPGLDAYNRWNGMSASQDAAGNWIETDNPRVKDTERFNQYGGSFGGPIIKNKLFAFFSYETQRNHSQTVATGWYATPQFIQSEATAGGVSAKILSIPGETPVYTQIISETCAGVSLAPTQCQNTSGGLNLGSPLTSGLGKSDPTFGLAATPYGVGNGLTNTPDVAFLQTNSPTTNTNAQYNGRLDYQATQRDLIFFGIYWTPVYNESYSGPAYSANLLKQYSLAQSWDGVWNHTLSPSLLNEARVGGGGWKWNELTSNPQAPFGLPTANFSLNGVNDYNGFGSNATLQNFGPFAPSVFNQFTHSYRDTLTWIKGSHSIKFGFDIAHAEFLDTAPWNAIPSYSFTDLWNFANDAPSQETGNFNPITGAPSSVTKNLRDNTIAFFIQDDWKVSRNLTLNLGIRWEDFTPPTETQGNISNVVLGSGTGILSDLYVRKGGSLYDNTFTNFEPQVGFAWSPTQSALGKRVSLRGGFGIGYNLEQFAITSNGRFNPPFLNSLTLSGTDILYAAGSNVHDISSFPSNPVAIQAFNIFGLPVGGTSLDLTGFPNNLPPAVTYRYSLESQFDLGHNWMASLGYSGSETRHLTRQYSNLNWLYYPNLNPVVNDVDWYANDANAHYNALLVEAQHRFSSNFQIDFQYKYSRDIDDGTQDYTTELYPWNRSFSYGPADFDTTHNYKIWGMYQPKFSKLGNSWIDKVIGGWTISGIINGHSGFPWTPQYCPGGTIEYPGSNIGCLYPGSYLGGATNSTSNSTFEAPFGNFPKNATAPSGQAYFTVPSAAALAAGIPPAPVNIYRNMFRGPGYFGNDVQLAKAFGLPKMPGLGENAKLNLQANFYNLINKENLQNISNPGTIGGPQFGVSQGGLAGRIVELQARFNF
jgi:hypothetical protein